MLPRRKFIAKSLMGTLGGSLAIIPQACQGKREQQIPVVISTWNHGYTANQVAWEILHNNGYALDAVEAGVKTAEANPNVRTVGLGGYPDRNGIVTLDACIMNEESECGAVAGLEKIIHPISVARKVMEESPHVMFIGQGALDFAKEKGFEETNLLTDEAYQDWQEWLKVSEYKPMVNIENHDTISMLAIDTQGRLCGACTTSGMAWKMHGRVGDSPIIGAGLFVDGEVGGACATGVGEAVIRVAGSAMVVEIMRRGASPDEACCEVVQRIMKRHNNLEDMQVGFLALNVKGEFGACAIHNGFNYAIRHEKKNELIDVTGLQS
ncbi:MAG: N(4)-(beta-N-acetylglucosaminyl)-L-asparaginase [Cyclobacteriaceae bacterium]|nr:N(4)-(beta-N-acetylglucosaminyl)-L-asparaginase [Cyclobacteriaceae bacterium]